MKSRNIALKQVFPLEYRMGSMRRPDFTKAKLLPTVVQNAISGEVLMLAWSDQESFDRTIRDRSSMVL